MSGQDSKVQLPPGPILWHNYGWNDQWIIIGWVSTHPVNKIFANVDILSSFEDDIYNFLILISPSKLDPEGPAYAKMMKSKKFDPKKSQVLEVWFIAHNNLKWSFMFCFKVMAEQERGNFAVDTAAVRQEREEGAHEGGRRI